MRYDEYCKDDHFRSFISKLEPILAHHGKNTSELQQSQVEKMMQLEKDFRRLLVRHEWGPDTYKAFINHILVVKRNILMARPYFRERDTTFKAYISPVLKERDHLQLYQFDINSQFIEFALAQKPWADTETGRELIAMADKVKAIRKELAECNMPLAISQARMFLERNRKSHLDFLDMNQTCFVGLLEGIDKFVGPYHRRFRAVLIGRMLGNLIESNSETLIHFFPPDKRRIYRARKIIGKMGQDGPMDLEEVCKSLNEIETEDNSTKEQERIDQQAIDGVVKKSKPDVMTTVGDLVNLLSAAKVLPSSSLPVAEDWDEDCANLIERYPDGDSSRPDIITESTEANKVVSAAILELSLFEQKLLKMRGVGEL